jgi:hypothetical protein
MAPDTARITLVGKSGCHLCDVARDVIELVCLDTGDRWVELSIEDDPALFEKYWEKVPVVLVDGRPHDFWRVSPDRLRAALAVADGGGSTGN